MQTGKQPRVIFVLSAMLGAVMACSNPIKFTSPLPMSMPELEGVWVAHYGSGQTDTLTLKSDGTFRQEFENPLNQYAFDSGWNEWILEELPIGIVRLHLKGGRYYLAGISFGESNGKIPCIENDCTLEGESRGFYDPFAEEVVYMRDELILVVQLDSSNRLILHHMWTSSDRGFLVFGGDSEIFHQVTK